MTKKDVNDLKQASRGMGDTINLRKLVGEKELRLTETEVEKLLESVLGLGEGEDEE